MNEIATRTILLATVASVLLVATTGTANAIWDTPTDPDETNSIGVTTVLTQLTDAPTTGGVAADDNDCPQWEHTFRPCSEIGD